MASEPVVWVIEKEHWPRACLRAELIERGYDAVGFDTVARALLALRHEPRPALMIVDLAGQPITGAGLSALSRAAAPLIGIGGAVELTNEELRRFGWTDLVRRPVSLGVVADLVDKRLQHTPRYPAPHYIEGGSHDV